ncbi:lyase family protein [Sinorhizobium meliloti]|uniref:lyase family protein n=1 Tax=Rhizobium meliloti TaxID=382 RepID=UPI001EFEF359|nr:lyase family protein [Sinorhizobium meliloti]
MSNDNRIEHDPLCPVDVPADRYYGAQTARALKNFPISGIPIKNMPFVIQALAHVKMAAAQANCEDHLLPTEKRDVIVRACQEVLAGKHDDEFLRRRIPRWGGHVHQYDHERGVGEPCERTPRRSAGRGAPCAPE